MITGHAAVNGIRVYYEIHGLPGGVPLVLLHGGGSTIDVTFGRVLPFLAAGRRAPVGERGEERPRTPGHQHQAPDDHRASRNSSIRRAVSSG